MKTRSMNRLMRAAWLAAVLVGLLALLVSLTAAQDAAPAAPAAPASATLTLGLTSTPPGAQDLWYTAASFQGSWGGLGQGNGQYRQPRDIVVDAAGNFYVSDHRNSRVQKLAPDGTFIQRIGSRGRGQGQMLRPNGLAVAGNQLYVADTDNHRVVVFNTNGTFVRQWGRQGSGNGQFSSPMDVALDTAGNVYVTDTWNHRIQVFTSDGTYLRQWGTRGLGDGQMQFPAHLDFGASGQLFVVDSNSHRIQVFNPDGTFLRKFGTPGSGPGQLWLPVGIDVPGDGFVYIGDMGNDRVQKLTNTGVFVAQWNWTTGNNTLSRPNGLLAAGGRVFVTDIDANRVQIYSQATAVVDHGQQQALTLPAGAYAVTQSPKAGWTFGSATCSGGNPSPVPMGVRLTLADGAAVTCGFTANQ
jgi:DNA-binding beta-propeller fold protein YncE